MRFMKLEKPKSNSKKVRKQKLWKLFKNQKLKKITKRA